MSVLGSMARMFFAVRKALQCRALLLHWRYSSLHTINGLVQLTVERLKALQTTLLVLDFDGVMAAHGALEPRSEVLLWLRDLIVAAPYLKIAILSNKPLLVRQLFFKTHFPQIVFFVSDCKKPYPMGLQALAKQSQTPLSQVLLVDDRWLTGMLAAILAGTEGLYVQQPYADFKKNPMVESFFAGLRIVERLFLWDFRKCKRYSLK